jgi:hypothetical protein
MGRPRKGLIAHPETGSISLQMCCAALPQFSELCLGPATFEALISPLYATLYQPTFPKVISGILLWSCEQVQRVMFWNLCLN